MPADDAMEVLDAINDAITELFSEYPACYRLQTGVRYAIAAPRTITLSVISGSSVASTLEVGLIGQSILISGDSALNQIADTNTLSNAYTGATGNVTATIYNDSIPLASNFSRFVTSPIILQNGVQKRVLMRGNPEDYYLWEAATGCPDRFVVEAQNQSAVASPAFQLRIFPRPNDAFSVSCSMEIRAQQFTLADLTGSAILPISPEHISSILFPMALSRLVGGLLWPTDGDAKGIDAMLVRASALLSRLSPDIGPGHNRVRTPYRY